MNQVTYVQLLNISASYNPQAYILLAYFKCAFLMKYCQIREHHVFVLCANVRISPFIKRQYKLKLFFV